MTALLARCMRLLPGAILRIGLLIPAVDVLGSPSMPIARFATPAQPAQPAQSAQIESEDMELFVGETFVLPTPGVARIAVGNGRVIHAATGDDKEVILFGNAPGESSLVVWNQDGVARRLRISVVATQARRVQQELAAFLARIPNARSVVVGDKVIIEGDDLSDADQAKIAVLAKRYPQIVDFTEQVGWERMIMMDVKVVELPRSTMEELGVRWDAATTGGLTAGVAWDAAVGSRFRAAADAASAGESIRPGGSAIALPFPTSAPAGYLGANALLSSRLNAMARKGDALILAEPQLSARSGSTARFLAGGEVPYSTTDRNGASNTAFKPYGVTLQITPRVDRTGTVRSVIDVEVSTVDPSVTGTGGPALKVRRTSTEFNVRPNETLVLSGFLSLEQAQEVSSVPGLARLPLLGALFRSTRTQRADTELVIFVTPRVVTAGNPDLRERVRRADALVDAAMPERRLLIPVHPDVFFTEPQ